MAALRFTTTRLSGLLAAGRLIDLQHSVIAPFLQRELGPRYGRLFADFEPEGSDRRAWYADGATPPRRVAELAPERAEAIKAETAEMIRAIRAFADKIAAESAQKANVARILISATTFPEEDLWCDGDQPIIVNWGFHRTDQPEGAPRAIMSLAGRRAVAPAAPAPAAAIAIEGAPVAATPGRDRRASHGLAAVLLWLLFAGLVAAAYGILLPACGVGRQGWPASRWSLLDACTAPAEAADVAEEGARLQGLVRQAELKAAEQRQICAAPAAPRPSAAGPRPAPVPAPRPAREDAIDRQVEQRLPPTAPRGAVEISLLWNNHADLDLIVDCPGDGHLSQASPDLAACGGRLLEDVNKSGAAMLDRPIEHAAWDQPTPGVYTVKVELYGYNDVADGTDIPFTIRVRRNGNDELFQGHVKGAHATVTAASVDF